MIRSVLPMGLLLSLALATGAAPAQESIVDSYARTFVESMLQGVGAQRTECVPEIEQQIRTREMNAVCARFEGSFERFEVRWGLQMILNEPPEPDDLRPPQVLIEALTDWEPNGDDYDRIYRVQGKAIGVRFMRGDVLMVW
jgi:hypothetical protein